MQTSTRATHAELKPTVWFSSKLIFLLLPASQLQGDERSENEEEEEEENSTTEDEGSKQHNGLAVNGKKKNGCFGCLSPPEDLSRSKTVY